MPDTNYDALLIVSFGGPEKREDVIPFLENVLRGKNVPRERLLEVAEHYYRFGGKSPINDQNRSLIAALREELDRHGIALPIYWGNRNWHPLLPDALRSMRADGVRRALAFATSAFSSYSGCRQYREDIGNARRETGEGAPEVDKIRVFYNHPGFIEAMAGRVRDALAEVPEDRRADCPLLFTAHSVPVSMAAGANYVPQLEQACRLIAAQVSAGQWRLVYQSRSGAPGQPWLEPDVGEALREVRAGGALDVVIVPVGFISDHMEVLYDLDTEAKALCDELNLRVVRAGTVGTHPRFIRMVRELIEERIADGERKAMGASGAYPDVCPENCCPAPARRPQPISA